MESSDDFDGEAAFVAVALVATFIALAGIALLLYWLVTTREGRLTLLFTIGLPIVLLIYFGAVLNYALRSLLGAIGDTMGATPQFARRALVVMHIGPVVGIYMLLVATLTTVLFGSGELVRVVAMSALPLTIIVAAYYWAYWTKEVPEFHFSLETEFKTEAVMRAEEKIFVSRYIIFFHEIQLRLKILLLRFDSWLLGPDFQQPNQ